MQITIFTPTYNRAHLLLNLFSSLCAQSFHDFEWLIVDDGSTDDTKKFFIEIEKMDINFSINYIYQSNGGKHTAINRGLDYAKGEWFFIVDSDDYLMPNALEKLISMIDSIENVDKYCCICTNRGFGTEHLTHNKLFEKGYLDSTMLERYHLATGERDTIFRTQVHKQYRYPVFPDEIFMTEAVVYNRMARDGYLTRFYNDVLVTGDYQSDGLTNAGHKLFIDNPKGYGLWLYEKNKIMNESFWSNFKCLSNYIVEVGEKLTVWEISQIWHVPCMLVVLLKIRTYYLKWRG